MTGRVSRTLLRGNRKRLLDALRVPDGPVDQGGTAPAAAEGPLNFAQEKIWFFEQVNPGTTAFLCYVGMRLPLAVDADALERALLRLVRAHDALRTGIEWRDGHPRQIVHPHVSFSLARLAPPPGAEWEAVEWIEAAELSTPFDLARPPLLRARYVPLADTRTYLGLTLHHLVVDGYSIDLLLQQLTACYRSEIGEPLAGDIPASMRPTDFARWQRQWLVGAPAARHLEYWVGQLEDVPTLPLPRRWASSLSAGRGRQRFMQLPPTTVSSLKTLCIQSETTMFMCVLALVSTLVHRLTLATDFAIGTPYALRQRPELQHAIGFLLNVLAVRTRIQPGMTFADLLEATRAVTLAAYENADMPFERVLEELQRTRDTVRHPIFSVFVNYLAFGEAGEDRVPRPSAATARYPLNFYVREVDDGLAVTLAYAVDVMDDTAAAWLLQTLSTLAQSVARDPSQPLDSYPLLDTALAIDLPGRVNPRPVPSADQSLPQRLARVAEERAAALALVDGQRRLTYGELHRLSNRVAAELVARTPRGNGNVILRLADAGTMLVGMVACVKAGKAFVPLDPSIPDARAAWMAQDALAEAILHDGAAAAPGSAAPPFDLRPWLAQQHDAIDYDGAAAATAYILYTSGSTGVPKGVVQTQRNLAAHIDNYIYQLRLAPSDRLTLLTPFGFDASIMDVFGALLSGATLHRYVLTDRGVDALAAFIDASRISVYHSTPTVFRLLTGALAPTAQLPSIRAVVLGGESCGRAELEAFGRHFDAHAVLVNGYGPTECTLALQHFARTDEVLPPVSVPLGYPVPGTTVLIVDDHGAEVPPLFPGEIVIRCPQLAAGYWRRPELTAVAFHDLADGARQYATGDIGRRRGDGAIEYLGRRDQQVKIRGHRVELAEVKAHLEAIPGVRHAVAAVAEDHEGARLIAYVVAASTPPPSYRALRTALLRRVPAYLVPATFIWVDRLPVIANGKIDVRALAASRPIEADAADEPFATDSERVMAEIWCELFDLPAVTRHDDFFVDLGGDSLRAMQVVARLRQRMHVDVPLRAIFEAPTIAMLANAIRDQLDSSAVHLEAIPVLDRRPRAVVLLPDGDLQPSPAFDESLLR